MTPCYPSADTNNPDAQSIPSQRVEALATGRVFLKQMSFQQQ